MKSARKSLSALLAVVIAMTVVAIVLAIGGCGGAKKQTKAVGNIATATNGSSAPGLITGSFAFDAELMKYKEGKEPTSETPNVSPEKAYKQTGIKLKFPKETLGGKLRNIGTGKSSPGNWQAVMRYSSGFFAGGEIMVEKPDYRASIAADAEFEKQPNSGHIGADYHIVNVAGFEGKAQPPYEFVGYDGNTYKLPPDIYWWDNGIEYAVIPWKLGLTENQLMQVAESMYK